MQKAKPHNLLLKDVVITFVVAIVVAIVIAKLKISGRIFILKIKKQFQLLFKFEISVKF